MSLRPLPLVGGWYQVQQSKTFRKEFSLLGIRGGSVQLTCDNGTVQTIPGGDLLLESGGDGSIALTKKIQVHAPSTPLDTRAQLLLELNLARRGGIVALDGAGALALWVGRRQAQISFANGIPVVELDGRLALLRLDSFQRAEVDRGGLQVRFWLFDTPFQTFQLADVSSVEAFAAGLRGLAESYGSTVAITEQGGRAPQRFAAVQSFAARVLCNEDIFYAQPQQQLFGELLCDEESQAPAHIDLGGEELALTVDVPQGQRPDGAAPRQLRLAVGYKTITRVIKSPDCIKLLTREQIATSIAAYNQLILNQAKNTNKTFTSSIQNLLRGDTNDAAQELQCSGIQSSQNHAVVIEMFNRHYFMLNFESQREQETFIHLVVNTAQVHGMCIIVQCFVGSQQCYLQNINVPLNQSIIEQLVNKLTGTQELAQKQGIIEQIVLNHTNCCFDCKIKANMLAATMQIISQLLNQSQIVTKQQNVALNLMLAMQFMQLLLTSRSIYKEDVVSNLDGIFKLLQQTARQFYNDADVQVYCLMCVRAVLSYFEGNQSLLALNYEEYNCKKRDRQLADILRLQQMCYYCKSVGELQGFPRSGGSADPVGKDFYKQLSTEQNNIRTSIAQQKAVLSMLLKMLEVALRQAESNDQLVLQQAIVLAVFQDILALKRHKCFNILQSCGQKQQGSAVTLYQELFGTVQEQLNDYFLKFSHNQPKYHQIAAKRVLSVTISPTIVSKVLSKGIILHYILQTCCGADFVECQTSTVILADCYLLDQNVQALLAKIFPRGLVGGLLNKVAQQKGKEKQNEDEDYPFCGDTLAFKQFLRRLHEDNYTISLVWDGNLRRALAAKLKELISGFQSDQQWNGQVSWNYEEVEMDLRGLSDNKNSKFDIDIGDFVLSSLINCSMDGMRKVLCSDNTKRLTAQYEGKRRIMLAGIQRSKQQQIEYERLLQKEEQNVERKGAPQKQSPGQLLASSLQNYNTRDIFAQLYDNYSEYMSDVYVKCGSLFVMNMIAMLYDDHFTQINKLCQSIIQHINQNDYATLLFAIRFLETVGYQIDHTDIQKRCFWTIISKNDLIYSICVKILPLLSYEGGSISPDHPIEPQLDLFETQTYGDLVETCLNILIQCVKYSQSTDINGAILVPIPNLYRILQTNTTFTNLLALMSVCIGKSSASARYEVLFLKINKLFRKILKQQSQIERYLLQYGYCEMALSNNFGYDANKQVMGAIHAMVNSYQSQSDNIIQRQVPMQLYELIKTNKKTVHTAALVFSQDSYISVSCIWLHEMKAYLRQQLFVYIQHTVEVAQRVSRYQNNGMDQYLTARQIIEQDQPVFQLPFYEAHPSISYQYDLVQHIEQYYQHGFYINLFDFNNYLHIFLLQNPGTGMTYTDIKDRFNDMIGETERQFDLQLAVDKIANIFNMDVITIENISHRIGKLGSEDVLANEHYQCVDFLLKICLRYICKTVDDIQRDKQDENEQNRASGNGDLISQLKKNRWIKMNVVFKFLGLLNIIIKSCQLKLSQVHELDNERLSGIFGLLATAREVDVKQLIQELLAVSDDYVGSSSNDIKLVAEMTENYAVLVEELQGRLSVASGMCLNAILFENMSYVKYLNIIGILSCQYAQLVGEGCGKLSQNVRFMQNLSRILQRFNHYDSQCVLVVIDQDNPDLNAMYGNIMVHLMEIVLKLSAHDYQILERCYYPLYVIKYYFQRLEVGLQIIKNVIQKSNLYQRLVAACSPYICKKLLAGEAPDLGISIRNAYCIYDEHMRQSIVFHLRQTIEQIGPDANMSNEQQMSMVYDDLCVFERCIADHLYIKPYFIECILEEFARGKDGTYDVRTLASAIQNHLVHMLRQVYQVDFASGQHNYCNYIYLLSGTQSAGTQCLDLILVDICILYYLVGTVYEETLERSAKRAIFTLSINSTQYEGKIQFIQVLAASMVNRLYSQFEEFNIVEFSTFYLQILLENLRIDTNERAVEGPEQGQDSLRLEYGLLLLQTFAGASYIQLSDEQSNMLALFLTWQVIQAVGRPNNESPRLFELLCHQISALVTKPQSFVAGFLPFEILHMIITKQYDELHRYFYDNLEINIVSNTFIWNTQVATQFRGIFAEMGESIARASYQVGQLNLQLDCCDRSKIAYIYDNYTATGLMLTNNYYLLNSKEELHIMRDPVSFVDDILSQMAYLQQNITDSQLFARFNTLTFYLIQFTQLYPELCEYELKTSYLQHILVWLLFNNQMASDESIRLQIQLLSSYSRFELPFLEQYGQQFLGQLRCNDQNNYSLFNLIGCYKLDQSSVQEYLRFVCSQLYFMSVSDKIDYLDHTINAQFFENTGLDQNNQILLLMAADVWAKKHQQGSSGVETLYSRFQDIRTAKSSSGALHINNVEELAAKLLGKAERQIIVGSAAVDGSVLQEFQQCKQKIYVRVSNVIAYLVKQQGTNAIDMQKEAREFMVRYAIATLHSGTGWNNVLTGYAAVQAEQ